MNHKKKDSHTEIEHEKKIKEHENKEHMNTRQSAKDQVDWIEDQVDWTEKSKKSNTIQSEKIDQKTNQKNGKTKK